MSKKGVYKISGPSQPKINEKATYTVAEWYPGTPANQRDVSKVTWELFKKQDDGTFTTTKIKKRGAGEFTFTNKAYNNIYKVEGYLYSAEGKEPMSIIVTPQKAEEPKKEVPRTKEVLGIVLTYQDGSNITKALSYMDRLRAVAKFKNMEGEKVVFSLWEDDTIGAGHNVKNTFITASEPIQIDRKGNARWSFTLLNLYAFLAMQKEDDNKQHEYYVLVEFNGNSKASVNVNVDVDENLYKSKIIITKGKTKEKTEEEPNPDTAKASTETNSKTNKTDAKGLIKWMRFQDRHGIPISGRPKFGDTIYLQIEGENLKDKDYTLKFWEDDDIGSNDLLYTHKSKFTHNEVVTLTIKLTSDMQMKGEYGTNLKNRDSGEYFTGRWQELFVELIFETLSSKSKIIEVDINEEYKKNYDQSPAMVKEQEVEKKKDTNCGGKYCIKKGDSNELIREINIRLAGFGGNVPTDEFTERTEKMIKQFQRDYMKVPETGKVCGNVLKAIDEFSKNFDINATFWEQLKCSCSTKGKQITSKLRGIKETNKCNGFGDKTGTNISPEKSNKYEYPGIHRALLFGLKTILFYLSKQKTYSLGLVSSGYRCRFKNYVTTNHQGKAIDIQFNKEQWQIRGQLFKNIVELEKIRADIFYKCLNAKTNWTDVNHFSLEPIGLNSDNTTIDSNHTYGWIHIDVRAFGKEYLEDKYFCKNQTSLNGKSIVQLAIELEYMDTCSCYEAYQTQQNNRALEPLDNCEDKFKRVASITLKHEGGYVNDPADSGGMTNKGITIETWKQYAKLDLEIEPTEKNLKKITEEQATIIYRKRYWEPKGFCKINNERVGLMVYDWSITSRGAGKEVQKLLVNEFEQNIIIDGGIGPKTIEALNNVEDQDKLLDRIAKIRKQYYTELAYDSKGKPTKNLKFLKGWHHRVEECLNYTF